MIGAPSSFLERFAELIGLSWALGMALYTAVYFVFYLYGAPLGAAIVPALAVAVAGTVVCARVVLAATPLVVPDDAGDRRSSGVVAIIGLCLVALQVGVAVWVAMGSLLRYDDAWTVWATKARLFLSGGPLPSYWHQQAYQNHPNYPLNVPLAEALFFHVPGQIGLHLAALIGSACLVALLLLFYAGLARLYGRTTAILGTALLSVVPTAPQFAGYGYADVPVSMYGGAAALYLLLWQRARRRVDLILMGLLAGGAIWTKKEGLPIALIVWLALAVTELARRAPLRARLVPVMWASLATIALPFPWILFSLIVRPVGADFRPLTIGVFLAHAGRLPHIAVRFVEEVIDVSHWSLFWIGLAALLAAAARRLSPQGRLLLAMLATQLAVYLAGYVFSHWQSYDDHIGSSLNRLVLQAVPLAALVMIEAARALPAGYGVSLSRREAGGGRREAGGAGFFLTPNA